MKRCIPLVTASILVFASNACDDGGETEGPPEQTPTGAPICQEACAIEGDCLGGFTCEDERCVPTSTLGAECTTNQECQAAFSGWPTSTCTSDAECLSGAGVCITVGEQTYCTTEKAGTCVTGEEVVVDKVEGGTVTVCGNATAVCLSDQTCLDPLCSTDEDCTGGKTRCFEAAYCGCKNDNECNAGKSRCLADGSCGCSDASECTGTNEDVCMDGQCGCSSVAACIGSMTHPNTAWVCERI